MSGVCIDRCVCFNRTFAELHRLARVTGVRTLEELQNIVPFGLRCCRCHPYVRRMLKTGEVVFKQVLESEEAWKGAGRL